MEPSLPVSSPNNSQQSNTRTGSTESFPNPAPPTEMRQKVVEILASTANGCLQELGYYPGMPARLQELEVRNKTWQNENVKLFEDNKRLVETMKAQDEHLRLFNAPETEKIKRITNLELENRNLKMQLDQLLKIKSNADLITFGQDQTYAKLHREYMALMETYNRAYQEIVQLREIIRGGQVMNQSQQRQDQTTHQTFQQQTLRNAHNSRQILPLGVPHIPSQAQSGPSPNQHMFITRSSTDINSNLAGQQQLRRNEMEAQQNRELQRQHLQHSASNPSLRVSGNMINPMNPPIQMQSSYPHPQNQQVHGQPPSTSSIANLPPQYQYVTSMQHNSRPNQLSSMGATSNANVRRVSNSILPSGPSPTSQTFRLAHGHTFSNSLPTPTMRVGSAPLPTQNPGLQLPPHLTAIHRNVLSNGSHPMQNLEIKTTRPQSSGQHVSPTTISPNETLLNFTPSLIAPTPTLPTNVAAMISQPTQFSPSNTPTIRQSSQGYESANATAIVPNLHHSNIGTSTSNSASPIPQPHTMHLKRESMSVDSDLLSESHKKPRLESLIMDQNTPPPPSPSVPPPNAGRDILTEPPISEINPTHAPEQTAEEDDDEEEVVEVGPDGLRLVEDILEQVYGENRSGEVLCWFCKHRYDNKYTDIPPTPFIGATDQELEHHCINEHLDAWNQARADV